MTLRQKLLVPQLLIAAAITAYMYGVWMPETLAEAQRTRLLLIERHLQTVEEGLAPLLLGHQLDIIHENLTALIAKNPDWVSVQLFNAQGLRLYPASTGAPARPQPPESHRRVVERNIAVSGTTLGKLAVELDIGPSLSQDRRENAKLLRLVLGLLGAMLAVAMLTLELAVRRPLRQLAEASAALSRQDFAAPLPNAGKDEVGALAGSFAAMRDSLSAFNSELELRVAQRTEALGQANKELEAFTYSVSHDLRTPLRAINGYSLILREDYTESLDEEGRRYLDLVVRNTQRMSQLIDDLLSFSRASRMKFEVEAVDMGHLAQEVFDELREAVTSRNISLRVGDLPCVHGDSAMIRQVFRNLIGNAVKFTARQQEAVIEVLGAVEGTENVYTVKDNGAGFNMSFVNKLFGVFERLHSNEEFEGTGIGLAIVKRIIERHGGRVWAEGKAGEGAAIHFTLPVNMADITP
jgi:signal transduction histidine kinase